ncbi:MAG: hypothetical protein PHQ12_13320 [Chthoniobacteraceae bacterium]|nr:hypothetical protein [Chthoniobacteraceae bacterium]
MPNATTNASGATEQIENLQRQIEQLRHRAVLELKVKLAEARALVVDLQSQIEKITGETAPGKPVGRKPRTSVTIAQVVEAIKGGAANYRSVALKLGSSSATVAKKIKAEGKAAGISSTGRKAAFKLIVK